MTAPRNSGVPIVKSTCPRVRNTRESATVEAFNDDARHRPNERRNKERARRMWMKAKE
ncbi:hypothetical protein BIFADO_00982 [Bifidobacterium adolescentis L2-32]|uniref:Uncharacterized protein n=1 Tax=Bifidobacterium adolescentis L2-32 TaxID=411481 RepID=A7A567_BIFAD|nr:hypothetical protein BIFADO_00982 [Bifidobacterium adolescentis L2-32]